ncbi:MAG: hypothetical protein R6U70_08495 [Bacillota bacterium]
MGRSTVLVGMAVSNGELIRLVRFRSFDGYGRLVIYFARSSE